MKVPGLSDIYWDETHGRHAGDRYCYVRVAAEKIVLSPLRIELKTTLNHVE